MSLRAAEAMTEPGDGPSSLARRAEVRARAADGRGLGDARPAASTRGYEYQRVPSARNIPENMSASRTRALPAREQPHMR